MRVLLHAVLGCSWKGLLILKYSTCQFTKELLLEELWGKEAGGWHAYDKIKKPFLSKLKKNNKINILISFNLVIRRFSTFSSLDHTPSNVRWPVQFKFVISWSRAGSAFKYSPQIWKIARWEKQTRSMSKCVSKFIGDPNTWHSKQVQNPTFECLEHSIQDSYGLACGQIWAYLPFGPTYFINTYLYLWNTLYYL